MALQKTIIDHQRGIAASYFRLTSLVIDLGTVPRVQCTLSGYASQDVRTRPDGVAIGFRQFTDVGPAALTLMRTPIAPVLESQGLDLASLPADVRAAIETVSIYDVVARVLYELACQRAADGKDTAEFSHALKV